MPETTAVIRAPIRAATRVATRVPIRVEIPAAVIPAAVIPAAIRVEIPGPPGLSLPGLVSVRCKSVPVKLFSLLWDKIAHPGH